MKKITSLFILVFQGLCIAVPSVFAKGSGGKAVYVSGYTKANGTYVAPHYRSAPDGDTSNNWSTKGNINPYTGAVGTKNPDGVVPYRVGYIYKDSTPGYVVDNYGNQYLKGYKDYVGTLHFERNYYDLTMYRGRTEEIKEFVNRRTFAVYIIDFAKNKKKYVSQKDVVYVQSTLKEQGYDCGEVDGLLGERTWSAINQLTHERIIQSKKILVQLGYDCGLMDGEWNSTFSETIRLFQVNHKLYESGTLDPTTLAFLGL